MSWDQRHTFNMSFGYQSPKFGVTTTIYYNSGTPFTWSPISENRVANINLYPNNSYQRSTSEVDIDGYFKLFQLNRFSVNLKYSIYNLFDRLNEYWVDPTTGRAYTSIVRESDLQSHRSNFNDYFDRIHDPSMYGPPRFIKLGLEIRF